MLETNRKIERFRKKYIMKNQNKISELKNTITEISGWRVSELEAKIEITQLNNRGKQNEQNKTKQKRTEPQGPEGI